MRHRPRRGSGGRGRRSRNPMRKRSRPPVRPSRQTRSPLPSKKAVPVRKKLKRVTSSFRAPQSSKESLETVLRKREKPKGLLVLPALLGMALLVYYGGNESAWVAGAAVAIPGLLLLACPPRRSLGRPVHIGMGLLLGAGLLAFLPQFYWPLPDWRADAVANFSMDLPFVLSVQPAKSWEAFLVLAAGLCWFYALATSERNGTGWHYFFAAFDAILLVLALVVLFASANEWQISGAGMDSFGFFEDPDITANLLALGGLICAGHGLHGVLKKKTLHLFSLAVSIVVVAALYLAESGTGLMLFFLGLGIWLIAQGVRLSRRELARFLMPLCFLLLVLWVVFPGGTFGRLLSITAETPQGGVAWRIPVYLDCLRLIGESPLAGIGLGNFAAVFPQYRLFSLESGEVTDPKSDLLWFLAEGGLLGFLGLVFCVYGYFRIRRKVHPGEDIRFSRILLLALMLFFAHSLVASPAHQFGPVYFALMLAALAVPVGSLRASRLPPLGWRLIGGFLLVHGLLWIGGDVLRLGTHSLVARELVNERLQGQESGGAFKDMDAVLERALQREPLDWELHHQRGVFALSTFGEIDAAASDFNRAAFSNPHSAKVRYVEGLAWMEYDLSRVTAAWRDAVYRQTDDRVALFRGMIENVADNPLMKDRLARLSTLEGVYRREYLLSLEGRRLLKEIERDFRVDPNLLKFSRSDRSVVVSHWLKYAEVDAVEQFLESKGDLLADAWHIRAKLFARKAMFDEAVQLVVAHTEPLSLPATTAERGQTARLERAYAVLPGDMRRGLDLLASYLESEEHSKALDLVNSLVESEEATREAYYWRAEVLRRMGDAVESWHAYEEYLSR